MVDRPAGSSNNRLFEWAQKIASTFLTAPVANASLADMVQARIKGRGATAGTGPPQDLTGTEATAILDTFTSALKGLVPLSGGGTTNFLRADATFAAPPAGLSAATQADQEAASSNSVAVTPGRQHFHPSALKAWARWNDAGTIAASYGVSSVTDNASGSWTPNFATAFSSANYGVASCGTVTGGGNSIISFDQNGDTAPTTTACAMLSVNGDFSVPQFNGNQDAHGRYWAMFAGDQ